MNEDFFDLPGVLRIEADDASPLSPCRHYRLVDANGRVVARGIAESCDARLLASARALADYLTCACDTLRDQAESSVWDFGLEGADWDALSTDEEEKYEDQYPGASAYARWVQMFCDLIDWALGRRLN